MVRVSLNWYKNVELGCVQHHTKFERDQFIGFWMQANVKDTLYKTAQEEFFPLNINRAN